MERRGKRLTDEEINRLLHEEQGIPSGSVSDTDYNSEDCNEEFLPNTNVALVLVQKTNLIMKYDVSQVAPLKINKKIND